MALNHEICPVANQQWLDSHRLHDQILCTTWHKLARTFAASLRLMNFWLGIGWSASPQALALSTRPAGPMRMEVNTWEEQKPYRCRRQRI